MPKPKPKLTPSIFPSTKRAAAAPSPLELLAQRSSSRTPLNSSSPPRTTRAQARALAQPEPVPAPVQVQAQTEPQPVAGPSTPRRRGRPPKPGTPAAAVRTPTRTATPGRITIPARATPTHKRMPAALASLEDDEDPDVDADAEARRPRRFRPVFLDQRQWLARDPRVEREWRMVEARMREGRSRDVVRSC